MFLDSIKEGPVDPRYYSFPSLEDKKSFESVKGILQQKLLENIFQGGWSFLFAKRMLGESECSSEGYLSSFSLCLLQKNLLNRGFEAQWRVSVPVCVDYCFFKGHIFTETVVLRVSVPNCPREVLGYDSDGWRCDFLASRFREQMEASYSKNPIYTFFEDV